LAIGGDGAPPCSNEMVARPDDMNGW
jgi:hypothetical protein